jgi:hypothetical protein
LVTGEHDEGDSSPMKKLIPHRETGQLKERDFVVSDEILKCTEPKETSASNEQEKIKNECEQQTIKQSEIEDKKPTIDQVKENQSMSIPASAAALDSGPTEEMKTKEAQIEKSKISSTTPIDSSSVSVPSSSLFSPIEMKEKYFSPQTKMKSEMETECQCKDKDESSKSAAQSKSESKLKSKSKLNSIFCRSPPWFSSHKSLVHCFTELWKQ